jgi:hypothetical protein
MRERRVKASITRIIYKEHRRGRRVFHQPSELPQNRGRSIVYAAIDCSEPTIKNVDCLNNPEQGLSNIIHIGVVGSQIAETEMSD